MSDKPSRAERAKAILKTQDIPKPSPPVSAALTPSRVDRARVALANAGFVESEHPRGSGEHGGEFVTKGSGGGGEKTESTEKVEAKQGAEKKTHEMTPAEFAQKKGWTPDAGDHAKAHKLVDEYAKIGKK